MFAGRLRAVSGNHADLSWNNTSINDIADCLKPCDCGRVLCR